MKMKNDLCLKPVGRRNREIREGPVFSGLFLHKAELRFFHFSKIVTGCLVPSAGHKIPVEPGWYLLPQKVPLVENRFLQVGKGAENTKEKSRQFLLWGIGYNSPVKETLLPVQFTAGSLMFS